MTDEELDEARAREAYRVVHRHPLPSVQLINSVAIAAARLAREGWTPVDPDLIEAREIVANTCRDAGNANYWRAGDGDCDDILRIAIAAIKRGKELAGSSQ